ncbi:MAG: hypothetical protein MUO27_08365, partial [Sedimentisphaerales bacterium]|nr:hypothetical protein [Sedimentisphaerales bacterium]
DEHIKQVGTFSVNLRFADDLKAAVSVVVVPEGADVEAFKAAQKEAVRQAHHEEAAEKPEEQPEQQPEDKVEKPQQ